MTDRDYLWCALNLLLDSEEDMDALCPICRSEAERGCCPACGRETMGVGAGENEGFDRARFEQMKRGEQS